jgi:hypothetical protein
MEALLYTPSDMTFSWLWGLACGLASGLGFGWNLHLFMRRRNWVGG